MSRVSVCMATYNGAKFVKEQVDSILIQLGQNDELIVSDDGSTDATLSIIESYGDSRIKIFNNTLRKGIIGNFENALNNSSGEYIFFCDQDDVWLEGKVERCVKELEKFDLVMHDASIWDGEKIIVDSFYKLRGSRKGFFNNLIKNSFLGCCLAMRREVLDYILPFPSIAMHDIWSGLMVSKKGKVSMIEEKFILYRRHGNNASFTGEKSQYSIKYKLLYRLKLVWETAKRCN